MKFNYVMWLVIGVALAKVNLSTGQLSNNYPLTAQDSVAQVQWVDSVYNSLTQKEKIGQLFMVDVFSNKGKTHVDRVRKLVATHKIGGIIFSKGGPVQQATLTNELQSTSKTPLLIAMDAEWGLAMRLDSTYAFPWNMTLGATPGITSSYEVGKRIGEHCKRLGVHMNFAPVVDINTNPKNPIIGNRSFGEDLENVTSKATAFMQGMQSTGTMASAKHFPGHGDTDQDSHKTLPTVDFTAQRINSVELFPYKKLIDQGMASVMVAHLNIPSLEPRAGYPTSISEKVVTDLLKVKLGFNGLIFTDALNMKGASNYSTPGEIDLQAFKAGNDVLLISEDVPKSIALISAALNTNDITEERLAHSVKKILKAKYIAGLHHYKPTAISNLVQQLNTEADEVVYENAMSKAITLLKNRNELLPLKNLETKKIAYIALGDDSGEVFFNELNKYTKVDRIIGDRLDAVLKMLEKYNTVIIGLHRSDKNPWTSYQLTDKELTWLYEIARKHEVIFDGFVRPYMLEQIKTQKNFEGIIMSYQNSEWSQRLSAQMIFGARDMVGRLPVSAGLFKVNQGVYLKNIKRLSYGNNPTSVGLDANMIAKIDSLANYTISNKGAPGIQILVARRGKVVMNKSYGFHTYQKEKPVMDDHVYDIASVTKILVSLPLVMELEEKNTIALDDPISKLDPDLKNTNKENITIKEMLSHYGRLKPWIPFYSYTLDSLTKQPLTSYYSKGPSENYSLQVADGMFTNPIMLDTIFERIKKSDLRKQQEYKYSDLPYYLLKKYIESHYIKNLSQLGQDHFYESLGMNRTSYLPREKFPLSQIVPTENDTSFRGQLLHGYVHDQGAAMQGGIGGHAGLFSNANDVAKMMQMYLQGGYYGGRRYFKQETIDKFNTCNYCENEVRRGVGFDKPQLKGAGNTCGCVSKGSFGHSGFTGTYTWADPEQELVYVFLSNRVHPDAANRFIIKENIRTNIQQIIYDSMID